MALAKLTDGEIVQRLKAIKSQGSSRAAAKLLGLDHTSIERAVEAAKRRGLTASSIIKDPLDIANATVQSLQRELSEIQRHNESCASVRQEIYGLSEVPPAPPLWVNKKRPSGLPGVPMALLSDLHWGEVVRAEEVGGVNEFNRTIAKARLRRFVDTLIDLAVNHMVNPQYPGLVLCLGGDIISGNIHEELRDTNEGYIQQTLIEVQDELAAAITLLANVFGKVFVPCVVGNHGRTTMKPRAKGRAYESYEWNLYQQLERHFRNDRRVQFFIPGETDAYFTVLGHRFLLTHGDTLGVRGGDGIIGALGPIARGAFKVGRSESQIGRDFDTILMGHWHTYIPRSEAVPVIVNGTLKGYDEYARLYLRVPYSRPSQALWFVHGKHGITAQWQIFLDDKRQSEDSAEWVKFQKQN